MRKANAANLDNKIKNLKEKILPLATQQNNKHSFRNTIQATKQ